MKICIALHQCMDLGGIINHTEQLAAGLKTLGHEVHLKELVYADNAHAQRKEGSFMTGATGVPYAQGKGWNFERADRIPYKTWAGVATAKQILSRYDIVIWTVPVPPKNKSNVGNDKWPELYELPYKVKQIAISHDGNAKQGYPHIYKILPHLRGLVCVHHAALGSTDHIDIPRALIVNPQNQPIRNYPKWDEKLPGFVNMQTFKAWKHVHELIEAIAYMPQKHPIELREVAGLGIEYRYMVSEDKCKPQYFHGEKIHGIDETPVWFSGMKFWDAALDNGMVHHDYWDDGEVNDWLWKARVLVDPSWSKKYSQYGGHYNRVVVDAMMRGAIPVAHKMGMGTELFKPGEHYVDLSEARDPQEYAEIIGDTFRMDSSRASDYRAAARDILPIFDRLAVAERYIRLANGELDDTLIGQRDPSIEQKAEDLLFDHYGII